MKLKLIAIAACAAFVSANAQDIYTMEKVSSEDLNGTARFIGMGGAMSALGADISTMSTNPAGIGLFRHADISLSGGLTSLSDGDKFDDHGKTRASFDQIGIVYPFNFGNSSTMRYLNIGFNYHKRKNFHSLVGADQTLNSASQTWQMADLSSYWGGTDKGTPLSYAGYETYLYELATDENGNPLTDESGYTQYNVYNADRNSYRKSTTGGIQEYDFNISTNLSDRIYLGMTVGVYNVDIDSYSEYSENLIGTDNSSVGSYLLSNDRSLTGNGVDFKFGTIIYPISGSSFRFGLSFSTPVYYSLTENCTSIINSTINGTDYDYRTEVGDHDFNIHTPWKFNISAAGTIANMIALDAEYEYADFSKAKLTYDDWGDNWDDWGWDDDEVKDKAMNREARHYLKGVHTLRLGAEAQLGAGVALRVGYNYVSSPIESKAFQNQFINSASIDYSTSTDYMNLSNINRYTVGIGYQTGKFYADLAYQFQNQNGKLYTFSTQAGNDENPNEAPCSKINLDKNQFLLTLGYKF